MTMMITTGNSFDGKVIKQCLGIVRGIVVRSPTISQGLMGGLKSIVGGKIGAYSQMCEHAREEAFQLMIEHARHSMPMALLPCVTIRAKLVRPAQKFYVTEQQ